MALSLCLTFIISFHYKNCSNANLVEINMKKFFLFLTIVTSACTQTLNTALDHNPYFSYQTIAVENNKTLEFALVLPEYLAADRNYPILLALPPGEQARYQVEWAIQKYWIKQSILRNWIVVSPVAPSGTYFHTGAEIYIPALMDTIQQRYHVEGNKFHLAGISNGGISAFHIALLYTDRVQSLTVFPGVPANTADYALLSRLVNIPVTMYVGALDDSSWINEMDSTTTILQQLGVKVTFTIFPNEGHVINGLTSQMLFDLLDKLRP
jgi:dipeptidyl aminopeptidase/acylaminoacyl peptidase